MNCALLRALIANARPYLTPSRLSPHAAWKGDSGRETALSYIGPKTPAQADYSHEVPSKSLGHNAPIPPSCPKPLIGAHLAREDARQSVIPEVLLRACLAEFATVPGTEQHFGR
jgi:hypothetical protein